MWAGVSALGIGLGPITGGFLLEHFWWGSIFIVNVPIVIAGLVLGYFLVPESTRPVARRARPGRRGAVDRRRSARCCGRSSRRRRTAGRRAEIVAGLRRSASSLLGGVLRVGAALAATRCSTCTSSRTRGSARRAARSRSCSSSLFGTLFLLTQYLQSVLGYSTVKAGAVLLPQAAVLMIVRPARRTCGCSGSATRWSSPPGCSSSRRRSLLFTDLPRRQQRRCTSSASRC